MEADTAPLEEEAGPDLPRIALEVEHAASVSWATFRSGAALVHRVTLRNQADAALSDLRLRLWTDPALCAPVERTVDELPPESSLRLTDVELAIDGDALRQTSEGSVTLHATVFLGEHEIASEALAIEVLPPDSWPGTEGLPDLLASFVLPADPVVGELVSAAAEARGDADSPRAVLASIFAVVQERGWTVPAVRFDPQRIRAPKAWVETGDPTAMEVACLVAACAERAGLAPILALFETRVLIGAWLQETCFSRATIHEGLVVKKRVDLDLIALFEPGATGSFDEALTRAREQVAELEEFTYVIDLWCARKHGTEPWEGEGVAAPSTSTAVASGAGVASAAESSTGPRTRLDVWKQKLLDLSLRNRLLNHRSTKGTVALAAPDLGALEDALAAERSFQVLSEKDLFAERAATGADVDRDELHKLRLEWMQMGWLAARHQPDELTKRLTTLYREARNSLEEGGAGVLYLAIGFLRWFETPDSTTERRAPILLLPLEITRPSAKSGFRIRLSGDEPSVNVTLLQKLATEFDVDVAGLGELVEDESGLNVKHTLDGVRRAILPFDQWDVEDEAAIGLYSFTKFLMWLDLEQRTADLARSDVVQHLIETPDQPFQPDAVFPEPSDLDATRSPAETYCPVDADSSQLAAVYAAADGRSFVLQGPPGTGKSQTITNLISHCLADGKRVLFVSEKMAALNVVRKRLEGVGLGPFCLELHSNKAKKKGVLEQLGQALEVADGKGVGNWDKQADKLEQLRSDLNAFCELLHTPRALGVTPYQGLSRAVAARDTERVALDFGTEAAVDETKYETLVAAVDRMQVAAGTVGEVAGHPFRFTGVREWDRDLDRALESEVRQFVDVLDRLRTTGETVLRALGFEGAPDSRAVVEQLEAVVTLWAERGAPSVDLVREGDADPLPRLSALSQRGQACAELRERVLGKYDEALLNADLAGMRERLQKSQDAFFLVGWWRRRGIVKALRSWSRGGDLGSPEVMIADLQAAENLVAEQAAVAAEQSELGAWLGSLASSSDWPAIRALIGWLERVREARAKLARLQPSGGGRGGGSDDVWVDGDVRDRALADSAAAREALPALRRNLADEIDAIDKLLDLDPRAFGKEDDAGDLARLRDRVTSFGERRGDLRSWTAFNRGRWEAFEAGLGPLVGAVLEGEVAADEIEACFSASFFEWWVGAVLANEDRLRHFQGAEHNHLVAQFRDLDRQLMDVTRDVIHAKLAARLPREGGGVAASASSEVGVLQRQLQKSRGHWPIRKLVQRIPNLIARLKPCFLMSPLSVSQYLDPDLPAFDLVVFDEASQIPVWDAIGAMGRGERVVVVGDSRQLPPTSFFLRTAEDEESEDDEFEELESILDECVAAQIPNRKLRWHYRSRHESLIAFSNHHYYDGNLFTFPTPADRSDHLGVTWRHVADGIYDRAVTRANRAEAEAVVAELIAHVKRRDGRSVGVVTFSRAQQALVEDLLDQARLEDPDLDACLTEEVEERPFIKNLENVQGDERDVILFSVCYGPDARGKVYMNFGPLNLPGGERRLNVAITRAREQVVVFSTLRPDQIDLDRVSSAAVGVHHLKTFLEYADKGPSAIAEVQCSVPGAKEAALEQDVRLALEAEGYEVHRHVGCSGYRIDLAVVDPEDPNRYLMGIECDGANYASAQTARDRDRTRGGVLAHLGWSLRRIWSVEWYFDRKGELERLLEELRTAAERAAERPATSPAPEAVAEAEPHAEPPSAEEPGVASPEVSESEAVAPEPAPTEPKAPEAEPTPSTPVEDTGPRPYRACPEPRSLGNPDAFYDSSQDTALRAYLAAILDAEAPIRSEVLMRRLVAAWDVKRITSKVRQRFEEVLAASDAVEQVIDGDQVFVWRADQDPETYREFRVEGDERESGDIPPVEIANAARAILERSISIGTEDLIRDLARTFGFARVGKRVEEDMTAGIEVLCRRGDATRDGDRLVLPER